MILLEVFIKDTIEVYFEHEEYVIEHSYPLEMIGQAKQQINRLIDVYFKENNKEGGAGEHTPRSEL